MSAYLTSRLFHGALTNRRRFIEGLILGTLFSYTSVALALSPKSMPCSKDKHGSSIRNGECWQIPLPPSPHTSANRTHSRPALLNIMRLKTRSDNPGAPLFIITGGPGTSAVQLAEHYLAMFLPAHKDRDLVFVDQLGTGNSAAIDCPSLGEVNNTLDEQIYFNQALPLLQQCIAEYPFLAQLNSHNAANRLEQVRKYLNYPQIHRWGSSYGTRVALEYLRRFDDYVTTATLDGVAPIDIQLPRHASEDAAAALEALFTLCDAQSDCRSRYPQLKQQWQQLLLSLEQDRQTATVKQLNQLTSITIDISASVVANWLRFALYNKELSALVPLAIDQAYQGNFQILANIAQTAELGLGKMFNQAMHIATLCIEDYSHPSNAGSTALPPRSHSLMPVHPARLIYPLCKQLGLPKAPASSYAPVTSSKPTLLLSGSYDPVTPARWAKVAAQQLSNAKHIHVAGGHHGISGLGCIPTLLADFLITHATDAIDTECIKHISATSLFIDSHGPSLTDNTASASMPHLEPNND